MSIIVNSVIVKCDNKDCETVLEFDNIFLDCRYYGVLGEELKIACSEQVGLYWDIFENAGELKVFCPNHQTKDKI